jgi:hypothetical protein
VLYPQYDIETDEVTMVAVPTYCRRILTFYRDSCTPELIEEIPHYNYVHELDDPLMLVKELVDGESPVKAKIEGVCESIIEVLDFVLLRRPHLIRPGLALKRVVEVKGALAISEAVGVFLEHMATEKTGYVETQKVSILRRYTDLSYIGKTIPNSYTIRQIAVPYSKEYLTPTTLSVSHPG